MSSVLSGVAMNDEQPERGRRRLRKADTALHDDANEATSQLNG